ncbi:hypothetical protein HOE04_00800 [archaeon]|nr:hypothetical protein [archaeon]
MTTYTLSERVWSNTNKRFICIRGDSQYFGGESIRENDKGLASKNLYELVKQFQDLGYKLKKGDKITTIPTEVSVVGDYSDHPIRNSLLEKFETHFLRSQEKQI